MPHISEFNLELTEELNENVNEAFELSPRRVGLALDQHEQVIGLIRDMVSGGIDDEADDSDVDTEVFEPETGYLIFDWNVTHTREQALLLGMKADYSAAHSLLRNSLDGQMKGVFLNSLIDEDSRELIELSDDDFYSDNVDVDEVFEVISDQAIESGAGVIDTIIDTVLLNPPTA